MPWYITVPAIYNLVIVKYNSLLKNEDKEEKKDRGKADGGDGTKESNVNDDWDGQEEGDDDNVCNIV